MLLRRARHRTRLALDKSSRGAQIDDVVALCVAVERAQYQPAPVRLLGWA